MTNDCIVPKDPTAAMLDAGLERHWPQSMSGERLALLYRAMIAAAPAVVPLPEKALRILNEAVTKGVRDGMSMVSVGSNDAGLVVEAIPRDAFAAAPAPEVICHLCGNTGIVGDGRTRADCPAPGCKQPDGLGVLPLSEMLAIVAEARMHMQGKLSTPGARSITDNRLASLAAALAQRPAVVDEVDDAPHVCGPACAAMSARIDELLDVPADDRKAVTVHRSKKTGRVVSKHFAKTHPNAVNTQQMPAPLSPAERRGKNLPTPAFRLTWREGAYYVSEPNVDSTDCYTPAQVQPLIAALKKVCDGEFRTPITIRRIAADALRATLEGR